MKKSKQHHMDLNRETAMRLWNKSFGNETKVTDYAGRMIAKGAYNDRNSDYGWNVDHILPQSRGGITADHNLICCHILTNDEKADKFPCFNANNLSFEIVKVQNHYEIRQKSKTSNTKKSIPETIDFYDSAAGIRLFQVLKEKQQKYRFVGKVLISLYNVTNVAVIDFIETLFAEENISFRVSNHSGLLWDTINRSDRHNIQLIVNNYNMLQKEHMNELLDECVLLNTYLSSYFLECAYIGRFEIYYRIDQYSDKFKIYDSSFEFANSPFVQTKNTLFVNQSVLIHTDAGNKVQRDPHNEYTEYNYIFTNLSKNLRKEARGK